MYHLRNESESQRLKRAENKDIQKKGQSLLRNLFAHVNQVQESYPEHSEEYASLSNELNYIIVEIAKSIKTRVTLNKKRAEAKADAKVKAAEEVQPQVHILSVSGKKTGSITIGSKKKDEKLKHAVDKEKRAINRKIQRRTSTNEKKKNNVKKSDAPIVIHSVRNQKNDSIGGLLNILKLSPSNNSS